MPVSFHSLMLFRRTVILLLLGLLLPMQSTLAYARSIAMLAPVSSIHVVMPVHYTQGIDHHHATHHSMHHVDEAVVSEQSSEPSSDQQHHISVSTKSCHSPAKNSSACDGAKCCLIGAAAPPSCVLTAQSLETTRTVFITTTHPLSGFIPDGLERPPRTFHT
jgi:hypothetical protein